MNTDTDTPTLEAARWTRTHITPGSLFLLSYCTAFSLSKYLGLLPGYAIDDYHIISRQHEGEQIGFFLSQGRYGSALVDFLLQGSALNMMSFSVISLIASMVFSALFFTTVIAPRNDSPKIALASIAAVLGAHSYYSEYVTFRQSALPMSLMFTFIWLAALAYRKCVFGERQNRWKQAIIAVVAGSAAMGFNQLAVCYCATAVLYLHLRAQTNDPASRSIGRNVSMLLRGTALSVTTGATLIAANMLISASLRGLLEIPVDARATIIATSQLDERAHQIAALIPKLLYSGEVIASPIAKLTLLGGILVLLVPLTSREINRSCLAAYFLMLGTAITLVPVALSSTWWPVPRSLICFPFVLAGGASLLATAEKHKRLYVSTALFVTSALLFSAHSNTALLNQQRLNRWDIAQAQAIALRAAAQFPDSSMRIAITDAHWYHPLAPGIAQGDMNTSAMAIGWAVDSLFDESTGRDLNVRSAPELTHMCKNRQPFPAQDSMQENKGEVVVCM